MQTLSYKLMACSSAHQNVSTSHVVGVLSYRSTRVRLSDRESTGLGNKRYLIQLISYRSRKNICLASEKITIASKEVVP